MDNIQKEKELKEIFKCYNMTYDIKCMFTLINVHNLFTMDILFDPQNDNEYAYLGLYYNKIKKDYDKAEKYYLIAIEKGNTIAIIKLAIYYKNIKKDYDKAEKYYLVAIEKGNLDAINSLAIYYHNIK